jgi:ferrochelatase
MTGSADVDAWMARYDNPQKALVQKARETILAAGGGEYAYIPCLNDDEVHINMLAGLVERHCQGWPEASPDYSDVVVSNQLRTRQELAIAMGARR